MKHEVNEAAQATGAGRCCDLVGGPDERRDRYQRALQFSKEVETWPSSKLRAAYAQPEKVRRAEERERSEAAPEPS